MAFVTAGWTAFVYFRDRRTTVKPLDRAFPERDFRDRLADFCADLARDLDHIDRDTNWQHTRYVPLEAEVEVQRAGSRPRILDLSRAIAKNLKSRLILILGDAGSGKSVALRKFCRENLASLRRKDKIPVYVNLREWSVAEPWSRANPPTEAGLKAFVLKNLRERLSSVSGGFLDTYFDQLVDYGRFLFVFDSFDEIPSVMDAGEAAWLIEELSSVLERFLVGAKNRQAIVASREFRHPRFGVTGLSELTIRPLSERKIGEAIQRASDSGQRFNATRVQRALFEEQPHLVPVARNPFILGLMLDFAEHHHGALPNTQAELYRTFIARRLRETGARLPDRVVSDQEVMAGASAMAYEMFQSERYGLEIPLTVLRVKLPDVPVADVAEFLFEARVARRSSSTGAFGFVHRRFHEYFLVEILTPSLWAEHLESIPTDGRWREALALLAEVADEPIARLIAVYCTLVFGRGALGSMASAVGITQLDSSVSVAGTDRYRRALHSLRFLAAAFRGRREIVGLVEPALAKMLNVLVIQTSSDMVMAKHAVEALGILSDENIETTISNALRTRNPWVVETAFRACRYLREIPRSTKIFLAQYLLVQPPEEHLRSYKDIKFSLSLSENVMEIKKYLILRKIHIITRSIGCILTFVCFPVVFFIFVIFSILILNVKKIVWPQTWYPKDRLTFTYMCTMFSMFGYLAFTIILSGTRESWIESTYWSYIYEIMAPISTVLWIHLELIDIDTVFLYEFIIFIVCFILVTGILFLPIIILSIIQDKTYEFKWLAGRLGLKGAVIAVSPLFLGVPLIMLGGYWVIYGFRQVDQLLWEMDRPPEWVAYVLLLVSVLGLVGGTVWALVRTWRRHARDKATFDTAIRTFKGTKQQIAETFAAFHGEAFRLKYVEWLEAQTPHYLDVLKLEDNQWPGGRRPSVESTDRSSILLAKLDERWMGLDR